MFKAEVRSAETKVNCGTETSNVCPRCKGSKYFKHYSHVEHGVCFKCNGTGVVK